MTDEPLPPPRRIIQQNRVDFGYAYGVVGGVLHLHEGGGPVYLMDTWEPPRPPEDLLTLPSRLLDARNGIVPFTARGDAAAELVSWLRDSRSTLFRLLWGAGGAGKSRLATELARCATAAGWRVLTAVHGAAHDRPPPGTRDLRLDSASGVLILADYAERWPAGHLALLLNDIVQRGAGIPARALLLSRSDFPLETLGQILKRSADLSDQQLMPVDADSDERKRLFDAATAAFLPYFPEVEIGALPETPDLNLEPYGLTLALHMAALARIDGVAHNRVAPQDPARLSSYLLDRERQHWTQLSENKQSGLDFATPVTEMEQLAFAAALIGSVPYGDGRILVDSLGLQTPSGRALTDHALCYPPSGGDPHAVLASLAPDRLAEDYLGIAVLGDPGGWKARRWATDVVQRLTDLEAGAVPAWAGHTLTVLLAAGEQRWPELQDKVLNPLLGQHPAFAFAGGGEAFTAIARRASLPVLREIIRLAPESRNLDFDPGLAVVWQRFLEWADTAGVEDPAILAAFSLELSGRLYFTGAPGRAHEAVGRAADLYRPLAESEPGKHLLPYVMAMNNLVGATFVTGDVAGSLTAADEALRVASQLTSQDATTGEPHLAMALSNKALSLWHNGRANESLTVLMEAIDRYRQLTAAPRHDDRHLPDLARCLAAFADHQANVTSVDSADGVAAGWEAVKLYRELAATDAARFDPDLARALSSLGSALAADHNSSGAVARLRESLAVYHAMADRGVTWMEADQVSTECILGAELLRLGDLDEALVQLRRATAHARDLQRTRGEPADATLCHALVNLANALRRAGQAVEAVEAAEEAVRLGRELVHARPEVHRLAFAQALESWCRALRAQHLTDEATRAAQELVATVRRGADGTPVDDPRFAGALRTAAVVTAVGTRPADAIPLYREALTLLQRTSDSRGATTCGVDFAALLERCERPRQALEVTDDLLRRHADAALSFDLHIAVLWRHARSLAACGRLRDAVETADRAIHDAETSAGLVDLDSVRNLATMLDVTSAWLSTLDDHHEALARSERAADRLRPLYRDLDDDGRLLMAGVLNNLAAGLADLGRYHDCVRVADEVVALHHSSVMSTDRLPQVISALHNKMGSLRELGEQRAALSAADEAVVLARQAVAANVTDGPQWLVASLAHQAQLTMATAQRPSQAETRLDEALDVLRREGPLAPAVEHNLSQAFAALAGWHENAGQPAETLAAMRQAAALLRPLALRSPPYRPALTRSLAGLGDALLRFGEPRESEAIFREALPMQRRLATESPAELPLLAILHDALSHVLFASGDRDRDRWVHSAAVDLLSRLAAGDPAGAGLRYLTAAQRWSAMLTDQDDVAAAEVLQRAAAAYDGFPPEVQRRGAREAVRCLNQLAMLSAKFDNDYASFVATQAVALCRAAYPIPTPDSLELLSRTLLTTTTTHIMRAGRYQALVPPGAETALTEAEDIIRAAARAGTPLPADVTTFAATCRRMLDRTRY